ncbi:MAG: fructose-bisphosphatase class II, partial [Candidatus Omnitrophica bacterium]|nr:fructose-bisphosphatase class II [Candidatus Omnitrophota bacterium]
RQKKFTDFFTRIFGRRSKARVKRILRSVGFSPEKIPYTKIVFGMLARPRHKPWFEKLVELGVRVETKDYDYALSVAKKHGIYRNGNIILVAEGDFIPALELVLDGKIDCFIGAGRALEGVLAAAVLKLHGGKLFAVPASLEKLNEAQKDADIDRDKWKFTPIEVAEMHNIGIVAPGSEHDRQIPWNKTIATEDIFRGEAGILNVTAFAEENPWGFKGASVDPTTGVITVPVVFGDETGEITLATIEFTTDITELHNNLKGFKNRNNFETMLALSRAYCKHGLVGEAEKYIDRATMADRPRKSPRIVKALRAYREAVTIIKYHRKERYEQQRQEEGIKGIYDAIRKKLEVAVENDPEGYLGARQLLREVTNFVAYRNFDLGMGYFDREKELRSEGKNEEARHAHRLGAECMSKSTKIYKMMATHSQYYGLNALYDDLIGLRIEAIRWIRTRKETQTKYGNLGTIFEMIGDIHEKIGYHTTALSIYKRSMDFYYIVAERFAGILPVHMIIKIGDLLMRLGRYQEAREWYRRIIDKDTRIYVASAKGEAVSKFTGNVVPDSEVENAVRGIVQAAINLVGHDRIPPIRRRLQGLFFNDDPLVKYLVLKVMCERTDLTSRLLLQNFFKNENYAKHILRDMGQKEFEFYFVPTLRFMADTSACGSVRECMASHLDYRRPAVLRACAQVLAKIGTEKELTLLEQIDERLTRKVAGLVKAQRQELRNDILRAASQIQGRLAVAVFIENLLKASCVFDRNSKNYAVIQDEFGPSLDAAGVYEFDPSLKNAEIQAVFYPLNLAIIRAAMEHYSVVKKLPETIHHELSDGLALCLEPLQNIVSV